MIKKVMLVLLALSIFLGLEFSSPSFSYNDYGGHGGSTTYLYFKEHAAGPKSDALEKIGEVLGAELFAFKLEHSLTEVVRVTEIVFELSDIEGITSQDFSNIELVVDENANGQAEEEEPRVGGSGKIEVVTVRTLIAFPEDFTVLKGTTNYILKADLKNLVLGDRVSVGPYSLGMKAETVSGKNVYISAYLPKVIHVAGNLPPTLSWPTFGPAKGVGVEPQKAKSGDEFTFVVEYTDIDDDPPELTQIWIDENDNGTYEENEKYELDQSIPTDRVYNDGKLYQKTFSILSQGDGELNFKFKFSDGESEAEGEPAKEKTILVFPLAGTQCWIANPQFVSGQGVSFGVAVISFINVKELQESSLKDLAKVDLTPFKIEKVTLEEKKPLDDMRDYQIIQFFLSLDDNLALGKYTIPSFKIPYSYTIIVDEEEKEIQGVVVAELKDEDGKPIYVEKVPLLVKSEVDKKAIVIGDKIHLPFTFLGEETQKIYFGNLLEGASEEDIRRLSVELTKQVSPEMIEKELKEKLTFGNFKLLDVRFHKQDLGPVDSLVCDFTLSFYGLEGTEESGYGLGDPVQIIPSFRILHYQAPKEIEAEAKIETEELVTEPIEIKINSVLHPRPRFEDIKGALTFENLKFYWIYLVAAIAIALIIAVVAVRQLVKRVTLERKEVLEPWRVFRARVERLVDYAPEEMTEKIKPYLKELDINLRIFLGMFAGVSQEKGLAKTASEFQSLLKGGLEENLVDTITSALQQLDSFVFGDILPVGKELQKILESIKEVLRRTENNSLKK